MNDDISIDSDFFESAQFLKAKAVYKAEMMVDELHRIKGLIENRIEFLDEQIWELLKLDGQIPKLFELVERLQSERRDLNGSHNYGRFNQQLDWAWDDFFDEMEVHARNLSKADKKEMFTELLEMPGFDRDRRQMFKDIFGYPTKGGI